MSDAFDPYRKWLGIPVEEQPPNHYRMLGIPLFEVDWDVIENAAHRQMAYIRTFQNGKHADLSQRLLTELAAAKICLMTPERKAEYDRELREALAASRENWIASEPRQPTTSSASDSVAPRRDATERSSAKRPRTGFHNRLVLLATLFGVLGVFAVVLIVSVMAVNYRSSKQARPLQPTPIATARESVRRESLVGQHESPPVNSTAGAREARMRQRLDAVRQALAARDIESARMMLDGLSGLARDPQFSAEKERLDVIQRFLADFWLTAARGWERVKQRAEKRGLENGGKVLGFEFAGEFIEVKFPDEGDPQLFWQGKTIEGPIRQWPSPVVVTLAVLSLEDTDGFARYPIAAFLLSDRQGDVGRNRRLGEAFYRQAEQMVGQPNPFVRDEYQLDSIPSSESSELSDRDLRVRPRLRSAS
ncbi:MAG: hypothetical protein U1A77_01960 [Pirellulales bacterium]